MPSLTNLTENYWTLPITGLRQKEVLKQRAVDGVLVSETVMETYPATVAVKVLPPTLSAKERGEVTVTKEELKTGKLRSANVLERPEYSGVGT
jgi:hypothetical protein